MLRLVLAFLYLIGSLGQANQGGSLDPLGLDAPPPNTDGGGGWDPLG